MRFYYNFFIHLFAYEFVYDRFPGDNLNDSHFDRYLNYWINNTYLLQTNHSTYYINPQYLQQISLITNPFEQYARAYLLIYEQEISSSEKNSATLIKLYQKNLLSQLDPMNIISTIASSSNVLGNALRTLNNTSQSKNSAELRHILAKLFSTNSTPLRAKL